MAVLKDEHLALSSGIGLAIGYFYEAGRNAFEKFRDEIIDVIVKHTSNFQLLCGTCNTSKGARSTATSSVNIPFWNLD